MAFSASAIFRAFIADQLNGLAYDLNAPSDSYLVALFNNSVTPDKDAASNLTYYNTGTWTTGNEVSQATYWPAGGRPLASMTITTIAGGIVMFDAADTATNGSAATLSNVYGSMIYNDTNANNQGVCYNYFGGVNSVTSGTLTVVWNANGIARITV